MQSYNLHATKKKLAITFVILVFLIASVLEIVYFSVRYYKISDIEQTQFLQLKEIFYRRFSENPLLPSLLLNEQLGFGLKRMGGIKGELGMEGPLRFPNFLLLDQNGKVLGGVLREDIKYDEIFSIPLENEKIKIFDGNYYMKLPIGFFPKSEYESILFIKKQSYDLENYFQDLFFFFICNVIFSIIFYGIGLYFAGKTLKPIELNLQDMTDFIHNASHELKTPLSVLSSNLQILHHTKSYESDLVDSSLGEIKRMDDLIFALSSLSNIQSISQIHLIDAEEEIKKIGEEWKNIIQEKNIYFQFEKKKNFTFHANKEYFYILFTNLLKNAIKYNFEQNGKINIMLDKNYISISNTGSGISEIDLPKIFERFYKGEKSRNTEGFGIGLALVKKICDIYNWKISVSSTSTVTTFEIFM